MAVPTEGQTSMWHPTLGDLRLWYPAFEAYAASSPPGGEHFHGPHVAPPVDLNRVLRGLEWLEEKHGDSLNVNPLPTLEQLRALLGAHVQPGSEVEPAHNGSPCHNLWHWIHGGS